LSGIMSGPVGKIISFVLALVVLLVIANLDPFSAIKTELLLAVTTGAGFVVLLMLFSIIDQIGRK